MPEFEENTDNAKAAPYTYEPSKSTATELAGTIITPAGDGTPAPTKSRWGKRDDSTSSGGVEEKVPAGEVNLDSADSLVDSISAKRPVRDDAGEEPEAAERPKRTRRRSTKSSSSRSGEAKQESGDKEARDEDEKPKSRTRRPRSSSSSDKSRSSRQPKREPAKEVEEEPETFADKIVKWVRKLVTGGEIQQEKESQPRGRSGNGGRRRSSSGGSSGNGRRRRRSSGNGESRRSSGEGSKGGSGSRRSKGSSNSRSRRSSPS
jgi:hypothetical protein